MISGRSSGTGRYSYREVSNLNTSVMVAHMPEDNLSVRIVFRHHGETSIPIIKIASWEAELLWAALKLMAEDLKWDDRMMLEKVKDEKETS